MSKKIKLGDHVRDTISGYEGIATARHEYLNGCERISISGKMDDPSKEPPTWVFDEEQVEVVKAERKPKAQPSGGDRSARPPAR